MLAGGERVGFGGEGSLECAEGWEFPSQLGKVANFDATLHGASHLNCGLSFDQAKIDMGHLMKIP